MLEVVKIERKGYGYELDNPVKAMSTFGSYDYLNSLKAKDGFVVRWTRVGSLFSEKLNRIIDQYHIFVLRTKEPIEINRYSIFIDMYHPITDTKKPEDFE